MIKSLIFLSGLVVLSMAQRSPYAGSRDRSYPQVLPQYLPSVSNAINTSPGIVQRFGDKTSSRPVYEPYDPYNDQIMIERIKTWPKEKQPFWYLNREAIAAQQSRGASSSSTTVPRALFAGRL